MTTQALTLDPDGATYTLALVDTDGRRFVETITVEPAPVPPECASFCLVDHEADPNDEWAAGGGRECRGVDAVNQAHGASVSRWAWPDGVVEPATVVITVHTDAAFTPDDAFDLAVAILRASTVARDAGEVGPRSR